MTGIRTIEYVVLPTSRQKATRMWQTAGACRFVWNHFRKKNLKEYKDFKDGKGQRPETSFFSLGKQFIKLRKETDWLGELSCSVVRYSLKHYSDSLKKAMSGKKGFPKPRSKKKSTPGFTLPDTSSFSIKKVNDKYSILHISKVGGVILTRKGGNPYEGSKPKQVVIKHDGFRWRAFVSYEVEVEESPESNGISGVDRNARQICDSDGTFYRLPDLKEKERRLKWYQRKIARQVPGSKRRKRTRKKVSRAYKKIRNIRDNWTHDTTRQIAGKADVVVIEDLDTRDMTRSAKGTVENPGVNVKRKKGLNKSVLDTAWNKIEQRLKYKCRNLLKVSPQNTSRTCSRCGHVEKENRKSQERFLCVNCGNSMNADHNAAINIRSLGMALLYGEGSVFRDPANRKIDTMSL